jgi:high-affinity iron transporter
VARPLLARRPGEPRIPLRRGCGSRRESCADHKQFGQIELFAEQDRCGNVPRGQGEPHQTEGGPVLATFVIGLREGLEASLIVGIIAAFLKQNGRTDALRKVWLGVAGAVVLCLLVGIGLQMINQKLPQRQQEMLECVVAAIAVAMVTYMVLWMRRHSRGLKTELHAAAGEALASGSARALIVMAFLAVFREGFETAVFLLAAFQSATSPLLAVLGAVLGIAVALALGWLIYRGGVRLNLSKFFRGTGVVLVLVAAGLVISTLRAAYEAGWLTAGQQTAVDLTAVIRPNSVVESLLTGVLGIRSTLPAIEVGAWLLYLVPMLLVVLWPARRALTARARAITLGAVAAVAAIAATVLIVAVRPPAATSGAVAVDLAGTVVTGTDLTSGASLDGSAAQGRATVTVAPDRGTASLQITDGVGGTSTLTLTGHSTDGGADAARYTGSPLTGTPAGLPTELSRSQVATLNGGRLPVGVPVGARTFTATWSDSVDPVVDVDPASGAVLGLQLTSARSLSLTADGRTFAAGVVQRSTLAVTPTGQAALVAAATTHADAVDAAQVWGGVLPGLLFVFAAVLAGFAVGAAVTATRRPPASPTPAPPPGPSSAVPAPVERLTAGDPQPTSASR